MSGTDKRTLFPSIDELQLVYSCATFLTVSQVTKQNETFSGHHHDVKEFWGSLGEFHGQKSLVGYSPWGRKDWAIHTNNRNSEATNYLLSGFHFSTHIQGTAHRTGRFPLQMYTAYIVYFHLDVCLVLLFFRLKNLSNRAMESWIIEVWEVRKDYICCLCDTQQFSGLIVLSIRDRFRCQACVTNSRASCIHKGHS